MDGDGAAARLGQTDRIVRSLLDADLAIAGINNEISDLQQERARLQSRSDARIKQLTIAAILLAGGGLVGELLEFHASLETLGSIIESVAAGAGIVIGTLALREEDRGRTRRDVNFNMLAQVLDRPPLATSIYPTWCGSISTPSSPAHPESRRVSNC